MTDCRKDCSHIARMTDDALKKAIAEVEQGQLNAVLGATSSILQELCAEFSQDDEG